MQESTICQANPMLFISSKDDSISLITASSVRLKSQLTGVSLVGWHVAFKRRLVLISFDISIASRRRTSESTVITKPSLCAAMATRYYGNHVRALISSLVSVRSGAAPAIHESKAPSTFNCRYMQ